jgi:GNAT superfamily N-acetyltransferase
MVGLDIRIISSNEIPLVLEEKNKEIDRVAFSGEDQNDLILAAIQWASNDWIVLGSFEGELVSQLCLLKRSILVGGQTLWVGGVGGVATHPRWQKHGFATKILRESETFMRKDICVPFGLLICADETQPVYAHCGWQYVEHSLIYIQNGKRSILDTCVMILKLTDEPWPSGEINLQGSPW